MVSPAMVTTVSSWVGMSTQNLSHCQLFSLQGREKIDIRRTKPLPSLSPYLVQCPAWQLYMPASSMQLRL